MRKKSKRPDSNAAIKRRKTDEEVIFFRVPTTLKKAISQAAAYESTIRGHKVSDNEWVTRACIDRIGEIFGYPTSRRFYQQFFNGVIAVHDDIPLPIPTTINEQNN